MWPEVRTVLPPGGLLVISLNWLLPNLFLHEEFSPALANMSVQGDGLFGGDLLGGRDRALTFSWHLVREPTQHPPPFHFCSSSDLPGMAIQAATSPFGMPARHVPNRFVSPLLSESTCPTWWKRWLHDLVAPKKGQEAIVSLKSRRWLSAEATSPTLTSGGVWRVGAVTMSLLGRRGEGSEGGEEAQGLK